MISGLVPRGIYRVVCRNLNLAVYDGDLGFIGIREKFGSTFLFTEYAWEQGPPYGTVREEPRELLGQVLPGIAVSEDLGSACLSCCGAASYLGPEPPYWACENSCPEVRVTRVPNEQLYQILYEMASPEDREAWQRAKQTWERRNGR